MVQIFSIVIPAVIILVFSIISSIYDIKFLAVPLWPCITGIILLFAARIIFNTQNCYLYFLSATLLTIIYFAVKLVTKNKLGTGDILFGVFQGLGFRPQFIWICLLCETILALIFFMIKKSHSQDETKKMPFIPFMASGLLIAFIVDCFL